MPRYIDADALIKKVFPYEVIDKKSYAINAKAVYEAIKNAPAADVVPRELYDEAVANWQKIHDSYTADCIEHYNRGRSEVAREIFEEIEDVLNHIGYFDELDFNTLKKKYTGGENNEV